MPGSEDAGDAVDRWEGGGEVSVARAKPLKAAVAAATAMKSVSFGRWDGLDFRRRFLFHCILQKVLGSVSNKIVNAFYHTDGSYSGVRTHITGE